MKSSEELKDLHGKEYAENFAKTQSPRRLERLIKFIHVNNNHNVADFACGNGIPMKHFAPKVKTYLGVDFSQPFIDAANDKKRQLGIENARFFCSTIEEFCEENVAQFDVGFAMDANTKLLQKITSMTKEEPVLPL